MTAPSAAGLVGRSTAAGVRTCLIGVLAVGFVVRLGVILSGPYIIHPDELFQYYEPAHRLAFGSGVVPWEFHDGARSWLIPGILAAIMKASRSIGPDPIYYIDAVRILCAILSLTVVYAGFELARRRGGRFAAVVTGLFCAIWIDPIYFAPSIMGEVLSGYCFLAAFVLADDQPGDQSGYQTGGRSARRMAIVGMLVGLAVCFRVQTGPAMLVFAVLCCRAEWRRCWLPLLLGGGLVVLLDLGLLDFLTWGAPFHSVWHYLLRGLFEQFGGGYAAGAGSLSSYAKLILGAWTPRALPLAFLAVIGAFRMPVLGAIVPTVVGTHLIFANAEYRYLASALLAWPILMGAGATYFAIVVGRIAEERGLRGGTSKSLAGLGIVAYCAFASIVATNNGLLFRMLDRNILQAFLLAHRQPQLCGLGAIGIGWAAGWSYTFLDRDAPLYGASYNAAKMISPTISVPQSVVLHGKPLPIYSDDELRRETPLYNFLIAPPDRDIAGFTAVACLDSADNPANPPLCLFRRPGGCKPPPAPQAAP